MELDRNEFERRVLWELRGILLEEPSRPGLPEDRISVEDVYLDNTGPEHSLVVLLQEETQPGCLFGWRWPLSPEWSEDTVITEDPNLLATTISANLEESLVGGPGLPDECDTENVTWF